MSSSAGIAASYALSYISRLQKEYSELAEFFITSNKTSSTSTFSIVNITDFIKKAGTANAAKNWEKLKYIKNNNGHYWLDIEEFNLAKIKYEKTMRNFAVLGISMGFLVVSLVLLYFISRILE